MYRHGSVLVRHNSALNAELDAEPETLDSKTSLQSPTTCYTEPEECRRVDNACVCPFFSSLIDTAGQPGSVTER
jgi:hypothetical protein